MRPIYQLRVQTHSHTTSSQPVLQPIYSNESTGDWLEDRSFDPWRRINPSKLLNSFAAKPHFAGRIESVFHLPSTWTKLPVPRATIDGNEEEETHQVFLPSVWCVWKWKWPEGVIITPSSISGFTPLWLFETKKLKTTHFADNFEGLLPCHRRTVSRSLDSYGLITWYNLK